MIDLSLIPDGGVGWLDASGPASHLVLSTRVRLARNLSGRIFTSRNTDRDRELVLRDVEGLTAPEVAQVLGIGVTAVKSRLHRARLAVRARMAPLLGSAEPPAGPGPCADVLRLFSRHLEGDVSAGDCAEMERHVQSCARCRHVCDSFGRTLALCHAAGAGGAVPEAVQSSVKLALRNVLGLPG